VFAVHFSSRVTLVLAGAEPHQRPEHKGFGALQCKQFELANTPMKTELYLGLDVDKEWIVIAVAEWGRNGAVQDLGAISNDLHALEKLLARLRKRYGPDVMMHACYEAGPCGFGIARRLGQLGVECAVVAPSLTPTRAGDRLKTDKRDARKLARLLRAGELTAIYIPEPTDEAIRDLCRARSDAVDDRRRSRHRLKAFLLRHGYRYQGKSAWSGAHERYLRELVLPHPAMKVILEEYLISVQLASERIARCEAAMSDLLGKWRLEPAVRALMAMKGFQRVAAMIVVSELGALDRFTHPRQVMAYLGLVPSEKSSSDRRRQGAITKCGNAHARWLLVECAQHYAAPPKVSKELSRRQQNQSRQVRALSWKAQNRLHRRYCRLMARRLQRNKVMVAVTRELCGFIWELLRTQECYHAPCSSGMN
jgi:transposase